MPITRKQHKDTLVAHVSELIQAKKEAIKGAMSYIGGQCLREMRENRRYTDQTNNLRSSTGFTVVQDGSIIESSGFMPDGTGTYGDGSQGSAHGQQYAESIASETQGIALVLSAGMDYASFVESKGLNVLDSAIAHAKREVPEMIKSILQ